jgi:hypothetical protein
LDAMADLRIGLDLNIYIPDGLGAALRRSPLVGADLDLGRSQETGRKIDL